MNFADTGIGLYFTFKQQCIWQLIDLSKICSTKMITARTNDTNFCADHTFFCNQHMYKHIKWRNALR